LKSEIVEELKILIFPKLKPHEVSDFPFGKMRAAAWKEQMG